jgi:hypothetical protein
MKSKVNIIPARIEANGGQEFALNKALLDIELE